MSENPILIPGHSCFTSFLKMVVTTVTLRNKKIKLDQSLCIRINNTNQHISNDVAKHILIKIAKHGTV